MLDEAFSDLSCESEEPFPIGHKNLADFAVTVQCSKEHGKHDYLFCEACVNAFRDYKYFEHSCSTIIYLSNVKVYMQRIR